MATTNTQGDPSQRSTGLPQLGPGLLLTPDFPPQMGGIARYLYNVYAQFDLQNIQLITPECDGSVEFDKSHEYEARRYTALASPSGIRGAWQFCQTYRRASRTLAADVHKILHCGHIHSAMVAYHLKRRYGTRYLVWTHALEVMDNWLSPAVKVALLNADLVITNSEFTRTFILSLGVHPERIRKVCPGADFERFHPDVCPLDLRERLGIPSGRILLTLGTVSKAHRYKGQDVVIRALPDILKAVPDLIYVIGGGGLDTPYLQSLANLTGVARHVKILGPVREADVPRLYASSEVFILNSREERTRRGTLAEGFGIVLLEASSAGKPVIGGKSGGIPDAVQDGVTGILVDPRDLASVAAAIVHLFTSPEQARSMGALGRQWVKEQMNWIRAAAAFADALKQSSLSD